MLSFCLGEIYEKNQSGAERLLLFYPKLRRRKPEKEWNSERNTHADIYYCITGSFRVYSLALEKPEERPGCK